MSDDFYGSIEPVEDFEALALPSSYRPLPDDWWIVAADVIGSTREIEAGRYKEVNTIGVSVIAAVRNAVRPIEVPYVFGGDGSVLCVPGRLIPEARSALAATVAMARASFGLELRAAAVPVGWVRDRQLDVLVARHRVSKHYIQCALFGGGAEHVERGLKDGRLDGDHMVDADERAGADYAGLECRWSEIPSPAAETVAVIVEAAPRPTNILTTYRWVMERTRAIYGDADACRPVSEPGLRVTLSGRVLSNETRLQSWRAGPLARLREELAIRAAVVAGWLLFRFGMRTGHTDWGAYKRDLVANTDFRKFDGSLRLVLAGTAEQRAELTHFLERLRVAGVLAYGVHVADSALMTCLIDERQGGHFHFVDAASGGYAAAAASIKRHAADPRYELHRAGRG